MNIEQIARLAWNQVRPADDPDFNGITSEFKDALMVRATAVKNTKTTVVAMAPHVDHGVVGAFEVAVKRLVTGETAKQYTVSLETGEVTVTDVPAHAAASAATEPVEPTPSTELRDDYPASDEIAGSQPDADAPDTEPETATPTKEPTPDAEKPKGRKRK